MTGFFGLTEEVLVISIVGLISARHSSNNAT